MEKTFKKHESKLYSSVLVNDCFTTIIVLNHSNHKFTAVTKV